MTYYKVLTAINNIDITERELQLVSFIAIHGNLYSPGVRQQFEETFNTTSHTIYNMVSSLTQKRILIKESKKSLTVNPRILPDFKEPIALLLQLQLWTEDTTEKTTTSQKEPIS
jgi:hypothetical protein